MSPADEHEEQEQKKVPGWRSLLADRLDLPKDIVLDLARIVMLGDLQLVIENHRGIVEYTADRVVVAIHKGRLRIEGSDLSIGSIQEEQITVTGTLRQITFEP